MSVEVIITDNFSREAKKLTKKYRSLKNELSLLQKALEENPRQGTLLTKDVYKIRLAIKSKGKGKSGGARVITMVLNVKISDSMEVYLLSIYDKSTIDNIPPKKLESLIDSIIGQEEE